MHRHPLFCHSECHHTAKGAAQREMTWDIMGVLYSVIPNGVRNPCTAALSTVFSGILQPLTGFRMTTRASGLLSSPTCHSLPHHIYPLHPQLFELHPIFVYTECNASWGTPAPCAQTGARTRRPFSSMQTAHLLTGGLNLISWQSTHSSRHLKSLSR